MHKQQWSTNGKLQLDSFMKEMNTPLLKNFKAFNYTTLLSFHIYNSRWAAILILEQNFHVLICVKLQNDFVLWAIPMWGMDGKIVTELAN